MEKNKKGRKKRKCRNGKREENEGEERNRIKSKKSLSTETPNNMKLDCRNQIQEYCSSLEVNEKL